MAGEIVNPVQLHGGIVAAIVTGIITISAKILEVVYARQKASRKSSGEVRSRKLYQEESDFRRDIQIELAREKNRTGKLTEENDELKRENLRLQGLVQRLQLRLQAEGIEIPEDTDADSEP